MKNHARASLAIPALLFMACSSAGDGQPESSSRSSTPVNSPGSSSSSPANGSGSLNTAQQLLQENLAATEITLAEATDIALAANPDAEVLETDLDRDDDELRYEIELRLADGSVIEVQVDAVTGDILRSVAEDSDDDDDGDVDDDDDQEVCDSTVSADAATAIAEAAAGGTAVRVEADDDCEFEVVVDTGAGLVEVDVSADGIVEVDDEVDDGVEDEDDDDEDDDEDDDGDDDGD
jgi:uncharacterized membrane protein YkoI